LRILHLGKFYPPHAGGVERHLADLAAAQVQSGLDVAALVHAAPGDLRGYRRRDPQGVAVQALPCWGQAVFVPISPSWPVHLGRALREFKPDLLHLHVPNPSAYWALLSRASRRLPWVVHWHADIPDDSRQLGPAPGLSGVSPFRARLECSRGAHRGHVTGLSCCEPGVGSMGKRVAGSFHSACRKPVRRARLRSGPAPACACSPWGD
jgi:glycosyltransferase involved in cell wall biosynthesis